MPPRSLSRRGGSQRWLLIPLVLTMLVLLVDASMHARSGQPEATMTSDAWVDRVLPEITQSSAQGREIAHLSSARLTSNSDIVSNEITKIAAAAAATYEAVAGYEAPSQVAPSAGLLDACLEARKAGSAELAAAVRDLGSWRRPDLGFVANGHGRGRLQGWRQRLPALRSGFPQARREDARLPVGVIRQPLPAEQPGIVRIKVARRHLKVPSTPPSH